LNLAAHLLRGRGPGPALVCADERVSREELARRVASAAAGYRSLGVRPGERVLIALRDTPRFAAAWLGAVHAGAVAIALNSKLTQAEYRHIRADSGARLALVDTGFVAARAALGDLCATLPEGGGEPPPFEAEPDAPAFGIYSSGTTGMPKGIVHAHRVALSVGEAFRLLGIGEGARVLSTSRFFFAYGLEHGLLAPLLAGASSTLMPDWPEPEALAALVARQRPEALFSVPTLYRRLLAEPAERLAPFRGVRHFVSAGERLSPQLVAQWRAATGGEILNLYGVSETFCAVMMTPPGASDGLRTGRPFPITELRLEDDVLWLRHPALTRGYSNLRSETDAQFRDGWFCTRDIFVRDAEGFYVHQGRADELVKVAGQWVWPAELEEAVLASAAVAEAACVRVEDGDGLQRLALFVTARDVADAAHAAAAACEALPRHKRPKWIRVVDELPRTATGKVQRFKLREILERELSRSG
jgi:acyl-coenzyme A synthetase/AMP-(fatty) acid ligase